MPRALVGIAALAILALPVVAQVRGGSQGSKPATDAELSEQASAAANAAAASAEAAMAAANAAAAADEAAAAAGSDNEATGARAYEPHSVTANDMIMDNDMSMDTNMAMDENMATENMTMDGNWPRDPPAPPPRGRGG